jgi:membrane associated rhomboid family serine protease
VVKVPRFDDQLDSDLPRAPPLRARLSSGGFDAHSFKLEVTSMGSAIAGTDGTSSGGGPLMELKSNVRGMAVALGVLWAIEIVDTLILGSSLQGFGIRPRTFFGLIGVVTAPLLHAGFGHLIANSLPFVILGSLVRSRGRTTFFEATVVIALVAGAGTWLLGAAGTNHIGASSIIFGWFGFLLFSGIYTRSIATVAIAGAVFLFYGGLIWGVLPGRPGVSWQGHLFGFLGGWLAARALAWSDGDAKALASTR